MISEIATDPFGTKYPPALFAALQLLQAIMRSCWPRIPVYCNEIIRILTVCYLNVEEDEDFSGKDQLKGELQKTARFLAAVMKSQDANLPKRVAMLIEKEPSLHQLFGQA